MKITPEIKFHECDRSAWVEAYITERLEHLDKISGGDITSASITVSGDHLSQRKGNVYSVKAEVHLPPNQVLVVTKDREIRDMRSELRPLIKQTFEALERQVTETIAKRRNEVKAHTAGRDGSALPHPEVESGGEST